MRLIFEKPWEIGFWVKTERDIFVRPHGMWSVLI